MASETSESSQVDYVSDAVEEKLKESTDTSTHTEEPPKPSSKPRLFNRERSVHQLFGGGKAADAILWRNKFISGGLLSGATITYFVLEHLGYSLLSLISNLLLATLAVLFVWSNAAVFLNRSPPPLPDLQISEESAKSFALVFREEINKVLAVAHDIALGKNFKQFLKTVVILWGLSVVGGWFHFLTLAYLGVVVLHTLPIVYETYEDQIESFARQGCDELHKQYKRIDEKVISKVTKSLPKFKKSE